MAAPGYRLITFGKGQDHTDIGHVGSVVFDGDVNYITIIGGGELAVCDCSIEVRESGELGARGGDAEGCSIFPTVGVGAETNVEGAGVGGRVGHGNMDKLHIEGALNVKT